MFAALMGVYAFYAFCWNTEKFLGPYMAESLGLSKEQVAAFYTLQAFGALIGALIIPQFADRYSRRNTFALIAVAFGLASIASLGVNSFYSALAHRFVMGFFLGGVFGCAVSLYVGLFSQSFRGLLGALVQLVYNGGDAALALVRLLADKCREMRASASVFYFLATRCVDSPRLGYSMRPLFGRKTFAWDCVRASRSI